MCINIRNFLCWRYPLWKGRLWIIFHLQYLEKAMIPQKEEIVRISCAPRVSYAVCLTKKSEV